MPRDEGIDRRPAPKPKPAAKPAYSAPAWKKPTAKPKDERDDEQRRPVQAAYVPPGLSPQQRPTAAAQFTPPAWLNTLSNNVSNWISNNIQGSQYAPAGLAQPQRPTTGTQFANRVADWAERNVSTSQYVPAGLAQSQRPTNAKQFRKPIWGGQPEMQVSDPYSPSLPTGTFFSGGSIQDGTREVRTGENTSLLLGGGGIRNRGTIRIAKGSPWLGAPSQPATSGSGNGGWGTTYKKYGGGGGGYTTYSSDRAPSWLMSLYNWNFKG